VYFLIFFATKNFLLSLFTSLLFALHPIQTEPVNAISFREDLLAMAFMLLSILTFVKSINLSNYKKYLYYALSLFSFTLGIFSKETALVTPFILILYNFVFTGENIKEMIKRKYYYLGFFLILLFYIYITRFVLYNPNPSGRVSYPGDSIIITFLTMSKVFVYYLKNLIFPSNLAAGYIIPLSYSIFDPRVFFSFMVIITLFIIAMKLYKKNKESFFGIIYFYITLLPVSNIVVPLNMLMSDRYLYMPSLGFCLVLSYLLIKAFQNKISQITIFSIILLFYSSFTIKQNIIWKDGITLWGNVIKKFPDAWKAYHNRGNAYVKSGLLDEAIKDFTKAIQLNPKYAGNYHNRGNAYVKSGLLDEAIKDFTKAIQLNPYYATAYNNRGNTYGMKGLLDEAIKDFTKAIQLNPNYATAYYNRGFAYYQKGSKELAIKDLEKSADLGYEDARKFLKEYFNIEYE
jgi:tetratricopeptide (TPR) repeat protein